MISRPLASKAKARASAWAVDPFAVPSSVNGSTVAVPVAMSVTLIRNAGD